MTHLELAHLSSDYLEGRLEGSQRTEVEAHLAGCPECKAMVEDLRQALALCRSAEDLEAPPWLVLRIMRATVGERRLSAWERLAAFVRPALQPRVIQTAAMAVFSLSFILYTAHIDLRSFKFRDLNPRVWASHANSQGHLLVARAEKFYYDLRVVYEIQSRLHQLRQQGNQQPAKDEAPVNPGTTNRNSSQGPQLAYRDSTNPATPGLPPAISGNNTEDGNREPGRSLNQ